MSLHQLRIVKNFFSERDKDIDSIVGAMFKDIFVRAPDAALLFKGELQTHRQLFSHMFRKIIEATRASHLWPVSAQTGNVLLPGLACLRSRHRDAGVKAEHFAVMKAALVQTLERSYPAAFTPEVRDALVFVFDVLTKSLNEMKDCETEIDALKKFSRPEYEEEARETSFGQFLSVPAAE